MAAPRTWEQSSTTSSPEAVPATHAGCYVLKDAFYRCASALVAAGRKPDARGPELFAECAAQRAQFVDGCPKSWVRYYDERFRRDHSRVITFRQ